MTPEDFKRWRNVMLYAALFEYGRLSMFYGMLNQNGSKIIEKLTTASGSDMASQESQYALLRRYIATPHVAN